MDTLKRTSISDFPSDSTCLTPPSALERTFPGLPHILVTRALCVRLEHFWFRLDNYEKRRIHELPLGASELVIRAKRVSTCVQAYVRKRKYYR